VDQNILLIQGPKAIYKFALAWLRSTFDIQFARLPIAPYVLEGLLFPLLVIDFSQESGKNLPLELVFKTPSCVSGLEYVAINIPREEVKPLMSEGANLIDILKLQFTNHSKFNMAHFILVRVAMRTCFISADGKVKMLSEAKHTLTHLLHAIDASISNVTF